MTANQIAYAKHLEERRHNRVSERHEHRDVESRSLTAAANWWQASTASKRAVEEGRHNRAEEERNWWLNRAATAETQRHNEAQEYLQGIQAAETRRHNESQEGVAWFSANALRNYQLNQSEALLRQAAVAERNADSQTRIAASNEQQARAALLNAMTNQRNADTRLSELAASIGMNSARVAADYASIAESQRASMARQDEINRSNRINEMLQSERDYFSYTEQQRHNRQTERVAQLNARAQLMNAKSQRISANASTSQAQSARHRAWNETGATMIKGIDTASRLASSIIGGLYGR